MAPVTTWGRFRAQAVPFAALLLLLAVVGTALLAPWIAPHDPAEIAQPALAPASTENWLGTDATGRDVLSRLLFATRFSLAAAVMAVGLALLLGALLGIASGYVGGLLDGVLMRLVDAIAAFPGLLMAAAVIGVLGPGVQNAMLGLAISFMPTFARLVRGQALALREEDYVLAARAVGAGHLRILRHHVLPNLSGPLLVQALMTMGFALLAEGALSFLGLSIQPPAASLGGELQRGFGVAYVTPRLILLPGLVITLVSWCFNAIGDGLRDALAREQSA